MFPTYEDYRKFLTRHSTRQFEQGCYYQCAMAILGEGPVGEGYSSDIDEDAPDWFGEHERRGKALGMWHGKTSGQAILKMLLEIDPEGCYPIVCKDPSVGLRRAQTVEYGGWRVRFDVEEPSARFLANFKAGTRGELIEALFDVDAIGRGPYSLKGNEIRGSQRIHVLGKPADKSLLAGKKTTKTRHLRAYRVS